MDLAQFGEELKKQRLARQVSLVDISAETRINTRFLEAIERGDLHVLPQTYVRAFLREYALVVGFAPDDVMRRYDEITGTRPPAPSPPTPALGPGSSLSESSWLSRLTQRQQYVGASLAVVIVAVVVVILLRGSSTESFTRPPAEISFDHVVRETEAATARPAPTPLTPVKTPTEDSLRLDMATIDSVWLSIVVDGRAEEYLFPPNRTKHWIAKEKFVLTMGNAGGAMFRLNGKELGPLGKRGAVLRSVTLSAATLRAAPPPGPNTP